MNLSPYVVIPIVTLLITQIAQFARHSLEAKQLEWHQLFNLKGIYSPLLAFATAILAVSLSVGGVENVLIAYGLLFVAIVCRLEQSTPRTPRNNAWTIVIALIAAYILSINYWRESLDWFTERPSDAEATNWLYGFGAVAVISLMASSQLRRRSFRKLPTARRIQRALSTTLLVPSVFGVGIAMLQSQTRNDVFTDRYMNWAFVVWIALASVWAYVTIYRKAPARLAEERSHFLKDKKKSKKKKRSKKSSKKR